MKRKTLIFTTFLLILSGSFSSCKEKEKGIEIPFTEYSIDGSSCEWKKIQSESFNNALIIINSKEKLESYIECLDESSYPEVDFSTYTLLLAYGVERYANVPNYRSLQQFNTQSYVMNVNLCPNLAAAINYWQVPIIVNKITDDCIIELVVTRNP